MFKWNDEARWLAVPGFSALPLSLPRYIISETTTRIFQSCIVPVSVTSAFCACESHGASGFSPRCINPGALSVVTAQQGGIDRCCLSLS